MKAIRHGEYKTAQENEIDSIFVGTESEYDGSGYVYNFPSYTTYLLSFINF